MYQAKLVDRKWHWIDEGVLPYALAGMRTMWVWLLIHMWSAWIQETRGDMLTLPTVFGLLAGSTLMAQVAAYRVRRDWAAALLVVATGLAAVALTLYLQFGAGTPLFGVAWGAAAAADPLAAFVTAIVVALLWRWGILSGRDRVYYDTYGANFSLGVYVLAPLAAISYASHVIPPTQALFTLLFFFALGLGALAIASVQTTRRFERKRSEQTFALSRYWLGTVVAVIAVLLVAALVLGQLFTPGVVDRLMGAVGLLLELVARVLVWAIMIVTYPIFMLFEWLGRLIGRPQANKDEQPQLQMPSFTDQFQNMQQEPAGVSPEVYAILRIVAAILTVGIIVLLFVLAYRRFREYRDEDVEETRELILSKDLLLEQLGGLFGRRRQKAVPAVDPYARIRGDDPADRIRRTYQSLLAWAAAQGMPRQPSLTVVEYGRVIENALPVYREPIATITAAYLQARYGGGQVSPASADEVTLAWSHITAGSSGPGETQNR